jgi:hypothetical protein
MWDLSPFLFLSLLCPAMSWTVLLLTTVMMFLLTTGPKATGQTNHGLNLPKLRAKINPFSSFFLSFWRYWGLKSGPHSTTWTIPPALYAFLKTGSWVSSPAGQDPPIYASCIGGFTDVYHHTQLVCWDGVSITFLPGLASSLCPLDLHLLSSLDYRPEPPYPDKPLGYYYYKLISLGIFYSNRLQIDSGG